MQEDVRQAIAKGGVIDITTTGRNTGQRRRIEMNFANLDGKVYITGSPGRRGWYANLKAGPSFIFHLKKDVEADLSATARPIEDQGEKREVLTELLKRWGRASDVDAWVERSPLVEVTFTS